MSSADGKIAVKERKSAQCKTKTGNVGSTGNRNVTTSIKHSKKITLPPVDVPKGSDHGSAKPKQKLNKRQATNEIINNISISFEAKSVLNAQSSSKTPKVDNRAKNSLKIKNSVKPGDASVNKTYSNKPISNTDKREANSKNLLKFVFGKVGSSSCKREDNGKPVRSAINNSSDCLSNKTNLNKRNRVNKSAPNSNDSFKSDRSEKVENVIKLTTAADAVNSSTAKKKTRKKRHHTKLVSVQNLNAPLTLAASKTITSDKCEYVDNASNRTINSPSKKKNFNKSTNNTNKLIGNLIVSSASTFDEANVDGYKNISQISVRSCSKKCARKKKYVERRGVAGPTNQSSADTLPVKVQNAATNESKKSVKPVSFSISALKKKTKSKCKNNGKLSAVNPKSTLKDQMSNKCKSIDEKLVAGAGSNKKSTTPDTKKKKTTLNDEMIKQWLNNFSENAVKCEKPEPMKDNLNFLTVHNNIFASKEEEKELAGKALFKRNKSAIERNKNLVKRNEDAVKINEDLVDKTATLVTGNDENLVERNENMILVDLLGFIGSASDRNKNNNLHSNQETANSTDANLSSVIDLMSKTNISSSSDSAEDYYSTLKKETVKEIRIQSNMKMASLLFANDSLIKYQVLCLSVIEDMYKLSIDYRDLDVYNKYMDQIKQEAAAETVERAIKLALEDYKKKVIKLSSTSITKLESEHLHEEVSSNIISSFSAFWNDPIYKQKLQDDLDTVYYELLSELCQIKFSKQIESVSTVNDLSSVNIEAVLNDFFPPDSWLERNNKVNKYRLSTVLLQKLTNVAISLLKSGCEKILDEYGNGCLMLLTSSSFDETFESVKNNAISIMRKINVLAVDDVIREFHDIKTKYDHINEEKNKTCGAIKDDFKADLT